jgi:hypothetical protein
VLLEAAGESFKSGASQDEEEPYRPPDSIMKGDDQKVRIIQAQEIITGYTE